MMLPKGEMRTTSSRALAMMESGREKAAKTRTETLASSGTAIACATPSHGVLSFLLVLASKEIAAMLSMTFANT